MTSTPGRRSAADRHRFGFWSATYVFLIVLAFSAAPSPLYVLYAKRNHFSSFMITVIYAAYAVGILGSLFLVSHRSDVHGRRLHLLSAVGIAIAGAIVFILWPSLAGLFVARVLSGVSVGLTASTATAYLNELHQAHYGQAHPGRPQLAATSANLGGLSVGALLTGLLAQYAPHPLVLPYIVILTALVLGGVALAVSPETRPRQRPLPAYHPQRLSIPGDARREFFAAALGVFMAYGGLGLLVGLAGTFLATVVHDTSLAMAGLTIFIIFTVGVAFLIAASSWSVQRLLIAGVALDIIGLVLIVVAAWLPAPSLTLFLVGGGVMGAAGAALFRGTLGSVIAISPADKLGETLAAFFLSGYLGLSLPAIAVGVALQYLSARIALLAFAVATSAAMLSCARFLLTTRQPRQLRPTRA